MEAIYYIASEYKDIWLILHLFAMVLGLGGATCTDILLVSFLKDFKIDTKEKEIIHILSNVVMIGVLLALFSGIMLFLPQQEVMLAKSKFIAKVIIFIILMVNGYFLHRSLLPKLLKFTFKNDHYLTQAIHLRHVGFIMGAISAVSWYAIFILGALSNVDLSIGEILGTYVGILLLAIIIALLTEKNIRRKVK